MTPREAFDSTETPQDWVENYGSEILEAGGPEADEFREELLGIAEEIYQKLESAVQAAEEGEWDEALEIAYRASSEELDHGDDPMSAPVLEAIIQGTARWLTRGICGLSDDIVAKRPTFTEIAEAVGACLGGAGVTPHPADIVAGGRCKRCLLILGEIAEAYDYSDGIWGIARDYFQSQEGRSS